jgi:hypothetical protein
LLHLYGGNRVSCFLQNICKLLPNFISWKMKFLKNWGTVNRCSAACTVFTLNGWMVQCGHIKCTYFSSKRKITQSGNLRWIDFSCNRNIAFQRPHAESEVHQSVL